MNKPLTVGMVQQSCSADRAANIEKSLAGIRRAVAQGAELVVLQELHAGLYFCPRPSTSFCARPPPT
jgi:N-carbamoylputrescine amidase